MKIWILAIIELFWKWKFPFHILQKGGYLYKYLKISNQRNYTKETIVDLQNSLQFCQPILQRYYFTALMMKCLQVFLRSETLVILLFSDPPFLSSFFFSMNCDPASIINGSLTQGIFPFKCLVSRKFLR